MPNTVRETQCIKGRGLGSPAKQTFVLCDTHVMIGTTNPEVTLWRKARVLLHVRTTGG